MREIKKVEVARREEWGKQQEELKAERQRLKELEAERQRWRE